MQLCLPAAGWEAVSDDIEQMARSAALDVGLQS